MLGQRGRTIVVLALLAATLGVAGAPDVDAARRWAPISSATIRPGAQMVTAGAQCTANFVFTRGADVLLGYAAHCAGTGEATDTDGCLAGSLPLGTPVTIQGATRPGRLVYSSWLSMQRARERNPDACAHNDFALVRVDPADVGRVNPTLPHWGGPVGLAAGTPAEGSALYTYGSSSLRLGLTALSPKTGVSLGPDGNGWATLAYTVTPGIPGDSGSALLDAQGRAAGVLSTIAITPLPASNSFSSLRTALFYAGAKGFSGVALAVGTGPFTPGKLPLGV